MSLISLLVWLIVLCLVFGIIYWVIGKIGLPDPWNKVALVLVALLFILILISGFTGHMSLPGFRL